MWEGERTSMLNRHHQVLVASTACSSALLSELAGSLSQRIRPNSATVAAVSAKAASSGSKVGAMTSSLGATQSLADRLARITSARQGTASTGTVSAPEPSSAPVQLVGEVPASDDSGSSSRAKIGKAASLRLLVRGTPDQQVARRVHEAEKALPRVTTSAGANATRMTTTVAAPLPPHTSPSSRRNK